MTNLIKKKGRECCEFGPYLASFPKKKKLISVLMYLAKKMHENSLKNNKVQILEFKFCWSLLDDFYLWNCKREKICWRTTRSSLYNQFKTILSTNGKQLRPQGHNIIKTQNCFLQSHQKVHVLILHLYKKYKLYTII